MRGSPSAQKQMVATWAPRRIHFAVLANVSFSPFFIDHCLESNVRSPLPLPGVKVEGEEVASGAGYRSYGA